MTWFKVDDKLPDHRKTRSVRKSHAVKRRDASPFGIYLLAGAWSTDGYVPLEWLEDQDDDAFELAERLVAAGLWHSVMRDGEPGYIFHDWHVYNPTNGENDPSVAGTFGNHVRWHVQRKLVEPDCRHCPTEPDAEAPPESADDRPDIAPISPPDSGMPMTESLPSRPVPSTTRPEPDQQALVGEPTGSAAGSRFEEFWDAYDYKRKRVDAEKAWVRAIRKAPADFIIERARMYVLATRTDRERRGDRAPDQAHASSWLNGERWADDLDPKLLQPQTGRASQWLALAAEPEQHQPTNIRAIGGQR